MTTEKPKTTKVTKAEKGTPQKLTWYQQQNAQAGRRGGSFTKTAGKKSASKPFLS